MTLGFLRFILEFIKPKHYEMTV